MSTTMNPEDAALDRNLRALAGRVALPAEPTVEQRQMWKNGPALRVVTQTAADVEIAPTAVTPRHRRLWALIAAGAAAALVGAILLVPTERSVVQAATILQQFRESAHRGLRLSFTDIGDEEVRLNGRLAVLFKQEFTLAKLLNGEPMTDLSLNGLYGDGNARFSEEADNEMAGLDLRVAGAMTADEKWAFVQTDDPAPLAKALGPFGVLAYTPLRNGLLVDFSGIEVQDDSGAAPADTEDDAEEKSPAGATLNIVTDDEGSDELETLVKQFMLGQAAPEEIDRLVSKVEEVAAEVRVDEVAPGEYVLTAHDFSKSAAEGDPDAAWLPDLTFQVAYRPQLGVEWAAAAGVGVLGGTARLEFIDALGDADRVDRQTFLQDGATTVLNLNELAKQIEALSDQSKSQSPKD